MLEVLHTVISTIGAVGSGEVSSSPLSVESPFAEMIRLIQVGIFAGVLYLIKGVKQTRETSGEVHSDILDSISELKDQMDSMRTERKTEINQLKAELEELKVGK